MTQPGPGELFADRFEIERLAGRGGMGAVYRARDRLSGDPVALKLQRGGAEDLRHGERFLREARLLAELRHQGIVGHVAHGETADGQCFLAMEWLEGEDLGARLLRGPLSLQETLLLLQRIAEALALLHQRGVVHRDLKPSNLFLPAGELAQVKLLDFGIARQQGGAPSLTRPGTVLGTPGYMAPEQARGSPELSPAADIFALGCVLYECLLGEPPFAAEHFAAVLVRILFDEPAPVAARRPGVPKTIVSLLAGMLHKDASQRIADAHALRERLSQLGELAALPALPPPLASKPAERFADREQGLFSLVVAAAPRAERAPGATLPVTHAQPDGERRAALLAALRAMGGRAEYLLDGVLAATAQSSGSALDQVAMAARLALAVKEQWPEAAVVLNTGLGIAHGATAVGEVADRAVKALKPRCSEPAEPPQGAASGVWLDELSARLLGPSFLLSEASSGVRLLGEEREADASRPLLGKPTPFVGRDAELALLAGALAGCIEKRVAGAVLATAPPGLGKSRLRHEFLRRVEKMPERVTVLLGRGELMSAGAPYGVIGAAIRRLCGLTGSEPLAEQQQRLRARLTRHLPAPERERTVLFVSELCNVPCPDAGHPMLQAARQEPKLMREGLRRALLDWLAAECAVAPVLLVLDDLQWADALTVAALEDLLREQAEAPLLVLGFARPEIDDSFPELWRNRLTHRLRLQRLGKKACERLVYRVLGKEVDAEAVARVVGHAAGNALLLEELIRALAAGKSVDRPETVLAMLQARIGRLERGVGRVVRAAAVFGQRCWRGGVAAILGHAQDSAQVAAWLTAASEAELLQVQRSSRLAGETEYEFRHALMRDAAYGLLLPSDLVSGHRTAAEFLEKAGEDNAVIAEHFERSGDKHRAARGYLAAAETALLRGNYQGSLQHVTRGLECEPAGDLAGSLRSIESYAAITLDRHDRLGAAEVALAQLRVGSLGWCRAIFPRIVSVLPHSPTEGFALISTLLAAKPDPEGLVAYTEALFNTAALCLVSTPAPLVATVIGALTRTIDDAGATHPTLRRYLHLTLGNAAIFRGPRPWSALTEYRRAVALAEEAGDVFISLSARATDVEWAWLDLGDVEGANQRLAALAGEIEQSQIMTIVGLWRYLRARALCELGQESAWRQAAELVAPMLQESGGFFLFPVLAQGIMARLALLSGRPDEAAQRAESPMQMFFAVPMWASHSAAVQVRALLQQGLVSQAVAAAERVLGYLPVIGGIGVAEVEFRLAASEAFQAAADPARAQQELRETLRHIRLRAEDIRDPYWRDRYLTCNPACRVARRLSERWGLEVPDTLASRDGKGGAG